MPRMKLVWKILAGLGGVLVVAAAAGGGFVWTQVSAFDESMAKVYDVPLPSIQRVTDPAVLARGEHLSKSIGGCNTADCHGSDFGGGRSIKMGPVATLTGPNITGGGLGAAYSDAELARLIQHGLKKDGRSLTFMPAHEISWLPDDDVQAIVSYLRTVPDVQKPNGPVSIGVIGKVLDRKDSLFIDIARRIDHSRAEVAPPPSPTKEYGQFIGRACTGCHGQTLAGGAIPGAPKSMPIPTNLTPHETGLKDYSFEDFTKLLDQGLKKNGEKLNPFMPLSALAELNEVERRALYEYLLSLPPKAFGER